MEASMLACEQRIFYNSPQPSRNDLFLILHSDAGFPTVITDKLEVISQVKKQKEKKGEPNITPEYSAAYKTAFC